jgi:hypothetical protein
MSPARRSTIPEEHAPRPTRSLLKRGALALVLSLLAVTVARALEGAVLSIPAQFGPLNWGLILAGTGVAAVLATGFYAMVNGTTQHPNRDFVVASALITLSMIIPVMTYGQLLPGATEVLLAAFSLLELVAAVTITVVMVWGLGVGT